MNITSLFISNILVLMLIPSAHAQITADPGAPGTRRPTILKAGNGVPLVNIQTPSAAGVSHNTYRQFDVQQQGAILNNARHAAKTDLGGYVQGNPWLARGSARVILNEVNSNHPSLLKGHLEVAGQRAQVIIANPSGITCDGCGFINAHRATLTTGAPIINSGNLEGYRVHGGTVTITGNGMNARDTDYTSILSRAAQINAGIWANRLKVITGANQIGEEPGSAEARVTGNVTATEPAPAFAIDTALLGGMYAGKITLVGTEHGVGVRNAGSMYADAGEVIITADGQLLNTGHITGKEQTRIDTRHGVHNTGTIYAQDDATITTRGDIINRGAIDGGETILETRTLNNLGSGRIYGDHIAIGATTLTNAAENGTAPVIAARDRLDIGADTIHNNGNAILFSGGDIAIGGSLDAGRHATGQAATLNNSDGATIEATGNADIDARTIDNTNPDFSITTTHLPARHIIEYQGAGSPNRYTPGAPDVSIIHRDKSDRLHTPEGDYERWSAYNYTRHTSETRVQSSNPAQIISGGSMRINADTINNDKSRIIAGGALTGIIGTLNNTEVPGERIITDQGSVTSYWREKFCADKKMGACIRHNHRTGSSRADYRPAPTIQAITLTPTIYRQNTAPTGTGALIEARSTATGTIVRSGGIDTGVPGNRLFGIAPNPTAHHLIETDPAFTNKRTWLSSDYLLKTLSIDPALTQKRLGDGFYEQKLIREQVAQLTERRFLDGYANDEAQYLALMNNGATTAKAWNLRPGIALSAAQMAQLTSDIVWLVEKDITLPDGGTTKALVPRLYVHVREGDLQSGGALIAGNDVKLDISGDLLNGGVIAGRQMVALTADNIHNLQGRILGNDVGVSASTDLTNIGGMIEADNHLTASAGRDLNVVSTTRTQTNVQGSRTGIGRVAGLYVTGGAGTLLASAGRDAHLIAAEIRHQGSGDTAITAKHDIDLGTVTQGSSNRIVWNGDNRRSDASSIDTGSSIQTHGNLTLAAGNDLHARAADVTSSQGHLLVTAGNDIDLSAGEANDQVDETHRHKNRSGIFSSKTITTRDALEQTTSQATTFSGRTATVLADRDITLTGGNVVSDNGTTLAAHNNLNITAAVNTTAESHFREEKTSGLFSGGGIGLTLGSRQQSTDQQNVTGTAAASTIGSIQGDVMLSAGRNYAQTGSDLIAPEGDIAIHAQKIDITEARESSSAQIDSKFKQSGLTVAITSPVISAVQTAQQMVNAAGDTSDPRMKALAAANVALAGKDAIDAIGAGQGSANVTDKLGGVNLAVSIGSSKSQSKTTQTSDSARSSTVAAGGDIHIIVGGAGQDSNLTIQGSTIAAGKQAVLEAENQISLLAAQNTAEQHSTNKSQSGSVGVSLGTDGLLWTASASGARGNADGSDVTWTNTHVNAGDQVTLTSGGDTTLKGAVVTASQITANVGNDLHIESLQDTSRFDSRQQSMGGSISAGYGRMSGNLSGGKSRIDSDYASVQEQSGLRAGDGGFDVTVANDTDLKGGAITSTQAAIDDDRNSFSTGGKLSASDIRNQASYNASSVGVNIGTGTSLDGRLAPQGTSAGVGKDSGNTSSTTQAAISGIAGNKDARTGDAETGIARIFDADRVQKEIDAQVQITQEFGRQASKAVASYAAGRINDIKAQRQTETDPEKRQALKAEQQKWEEGGLYRIALHTAVGGLSGGMQGAAGAAAAASTAPILNDLQDSLTKGLENAGADQHIAEAAAQLITGITAAGIDSVASGGSTAGAATAFNADANNRQLHPTEIQWIKANAGKFARQQGISEEEATERLTQQSLKEVDYLWRAQLSDGDDVKAQAFLKGSNQTFKNDLGQQQKLFTTSGQQLFRPEMFADTANPAFYKQFVQSGVSRPLSTGLIKELKDSGIDIRNGAINLARAARDNPGLVFGALLNTVKGLPGAVKDSFIETGHAIGEGSAAAFNDDISKKLDAIYGNDISGYQQALLAIRTMSAVTGATGTAKVATATTEKISSAISKKLDEITAAKAAGAKGVGEAYNVAEARKLAEQLTLQSAKSPFTAAGTLTQDAIKGAKVVPGLEAGMLNNPAIPAGFGKYTTETFRSPAGDFQMHFYMNPTTNEVFYDLDYKAVFNSMSGVTKKP